MTLLEGQLRANYVTLIQRELIVAMNEKLNRLIDTEVGEADAPPAELTQGGR